MARKALFEAKFSEGMRGWHAEWASTEGQERRWK